MAMNPMQKKSRNFLLLGMFIMLILACVPVAFLIMKMNDMTTQKQEAESGIVYVLMQDVKSGQTITSNMLSPKNVNPGMVPPTNEEAYAQLTVEGNEEVGVKKIAKINISAGTPITSDLIADSDNPVTKDLRTIDFNMIKMPVKLEVGQYVDIRFTLPSGQDYLVISKKEVIECDANTVWLQLTEDEILIMNNAIVESYIVKASNLYATVYVDPGNQAKPIPTYPISLAVQQTFQKNPNILQEARSAYNARVSANDPNSERSSISSAISGYNTEITPNVEQGVEESRITATQSRLDYIEELNSY